MLCSAFQNLRRVPSRIFIYVQNVPRLFGARHFSLFFFSVWPQFLVNRASSPGTLKIAILGQSMGVQLSRQQTRVVVKHRAFSLAPLKIISISFTGLHYWKLFFFNKKNLQMASDLHAIYLHLLHSKGSVVISDRLMSWNTGGEGTLDLLCNLEAQIRNTKFWCVLFVCFNRKPLEKSLPGPVLLLDSVIALYTDSLKSKQLLLYFHA